MNFIKRNFWTMFTMAIAMVVLSAGSAFATGGVGGATVMTVAQEKARNVFISVKTIVFIVGGFGLVAVAFAAIFGKVNWKWFAGLAVGLAILAAAGAIVDYSTGAGEQGFADTFGASGGATGQTKR
jgi:hypothetical protein